MQEGKNNGDQKSKNCFSHTDLWLLVGWFVLGITLRFSNLGIKPASSIEIATLGFSLGNGFSEIPLDQLVSGTTLLSPLRLDAAISSADVVHRLFTESTHPPLYFWITHWWIKLFTPNGELVSLHVGRSLSAVFGGLSIPAVFGLSWLTFKDSKTSKHRLIAHLAAILMALSPYGIYLAQEARHYTLSILWIIASLSCLIAAIKHLYQAKKIPWWIILIWVVVNSLGIATHYFFSLAIATEGLIVVGFGFWQHRNKEYKLSFNHWLPIVVAGLGTLVGCLVWLPVASNISSNELTDWIATDYDLDGIWQPVPRMLVWLITMAVLLPVEGVPLAIAIVSVIIILLGLIWLIPSLTKGYKSLLNSSQSFPTILLSGYGVGSIFLYLLLIYGYGKDVSLAARYHFPYFPVAILLLAAIFAQLWQTTSTMKLSRSWHKWFFVGGKQTVAILLTVSLLSSITTVNDFGYRKSRQANRLAAHIQASDNIPVIIGSTYETLSELRELIALALAFETGSRSGKILKPQFVLVQRNDFHDSNLRTILLSQPKPLDLWGVNLRANEPDLNQINCIKDDDARLSDAGYKNRVYHCR